MVDNYEQLLEEENYLSFLEQAEDGKVIVLCPLCEEQNEISIEDFESFCWFCDELLENPFNYYSQIMGNLDN